MEEERKDCTKHTISTIPALYLIHYRRSPVQNRRRLKINVSMQTDNLEAMHTFVLVLSLEEMKRNTVPHKSQQREGNMQHTHSYLPNGRGTGSRLQRHSVTESTNPSMRLDGTISGMSDVGSGDAAVPCRITACMYKCC